MTTTLYCDRCDHRTDKGQAFLARHLNEAHGLNPSAAINEAGDIAAGNSAAARVAKLEVENAKLRAALERADDMANALVVYFNKRGVNHSMRKGNEDIGDLADALSNYGPLRLAEMDARQRDIVQGITERRAALSRQQGA